MVHRFVATLGKELLEVAVEPLEGGSFRVVIEGRERLLDARRVESACWSVLPPEGGAVHLVDLDAPRGRVGDWNISIGGAQVMTQWMDARAAHAARVVAPRAGGGPAQVRSPMPGKVVKVLVKLGDTVELGQSVAVVEAMKMENELRAPCAGVIAEVAVRDGVAVEAGQLLATIAE